MDKGLFVLINETLITTKSGNQFPLNIEDWKFKTNFIQLFKDAIEKGYKIILLDNQFSIGDGFIPESTFINKLNYISSIIERDLDVDTNTVCYVYCKSRKDTFRSLPNPGMFYEMALEHELCLAHSVLICSNEEDKQSSFFGGLSTAYTIYELPFISLL